MIEHKQIFVDGKWVDSSGRDVLKVINPVTEEPIATVPRGIDRGRRSGRAGCRQGISELVAVLGGEAGRDLHEARPPDRGPGARRSPGRSSASSATRRRGRKGRRRPERSRSSTSLPRCLREISWAEQVGNTTVRREAVRSRRRDHGMERAPAVGHLQGGGGDGGRMHRRVQARRGRTADRLHICARCAPKRACRQASSTSSAAPGRRSARR